MKTRLDFFRPAILAGIFIGIAGFGFLTNKTVGTFLFMLGLIAIIKYKAKLYTGTAGFINWIIDVPDLLIILFGNILGCLLVSVLTKYSPLPLQDSAVQILETRISAGWFGCGLLAIGCGLLMTTAVFSLKKSDNDITNWLPLFLAVPLFIICGFPHCIADSFYYCSLPWTVIKENIQYIIPIWISSVVGNFIGCNLYRIILNND